MIRISKAVFAVLGVSLLLGLFAGSAQATPTFEAGSYPALVKGGAIVSIGTEIGAIECPYDYEGTLKEASSTLDLEMFIEYYNCSAPSGMTVSITNPGGCGKLFHASQKESSDQYKGQLTVNCPAGYALSFDMATCRVEIPRQEGLSTMDIDTDTGSPNRVTLDFEISELTYVVAFDGFLCPYKGTGTKTGPMTSEPSLLKAFNPSKTTEEIGLAVTGE